MENENYFLLATRHAPGLGVKIGETHTPIVNEEKERIGMIYPVSEMRFEVGEFDCFWYPNDGTVFLYKTKRGAGGNREISGQMRPQKETGIRNHNDAIAWAQGTVHILTGGKNEV